MNSTTKLRRARGHAFLADIDAGRATLDALKTENGEMRPPSWLKAEALAITLEGRAAKSPKPTPTRATRRADKSSARRGLERRARLAFAYTDEQLDELADALLKKIVEAAEEEDEEEEEDPEDDDDGPKKDDEEDRAARSFERAGHRFDLSGVDFRPAAGSFQLGEKPASEFVRLTAQAAASKVRR